VPSFVLSLFEDRLKVGQPETVGFFYSVNYTKNDGLMGFNGDLIWFNGISW
jgi:hypothetical protein